MLEVNAEWHISTTQSCRWAFLSTALGIDVDTTTCRALQLLSLVSMGKAASCDTNGRFLMLARLGDMMAWWRLG